MKRIPTMTVTTACSVTLLAIAPAMGATTPVHPSSEPGHASILSSFYGGAFTDDGSGGFTNGAITAARVDDALDQTFDAGSYDALAMARYAGYSQSFGYMDDQGGYQNIFDLTGSGAGASVAGSGSVVLSDGVSFARGGQGDTFSTSQADNADGADHVVTYQIFGLDTPQTVYALFFEDALNGDFDFNDMVVQLKQGAVAAVPTPSAIAAGLALLGGLASTRRRRTPA